MNRTILSVENFLKTVAFNPGDKILAAVSGGADSIAMLHLLKKTGDSYLFSENYSKISNLNTQIICAHINHHLRGKESDTDESFVSNVCVDWNIPLYIEQIDVKAYARENKLSTETAARHLRLEALERIALKTGCKYIATAHHKDDQAETVLFRLLRGTAFAGLAGIRPTREHLGLQWIRPMLNIRKTEIETYCKQNNIAWRHDTSNDQTHFRRNWIRHKLLPHLQKQSQTDLADKLAALAQSSLSLQQQIESLAAKILCQAQSKIENRKLVLSLSNGSSLNGVAATDPDLSGEVNEQSDTKDDVSLSAAVIRQAGPFVAAEILRMVLTHIGCGLRDISLSHYQKFLQLLDKPAGTLQLPGGCTIQKTKTGDSCLLFQSKIKKPVLSSSKDRKSKIDSWMDGFSDNIEIPFEGVVHFAGWSIQTRIIQITKNDLLSFQKQKNIFKQWFNLKKIKSPLIVRNRRKDDSFTPFGRKTKKRISRFLTDSQIPENQRKTCFIIEDKTGILWLAPIRRSTLAAINSRTIDVLQICITKL